MILVVPGHPSVDRLYEVDRLAPDEIHRPGPPVVVAGGKGLNVARAAQSLGAEVEVLAILAGHAGRWIAETLRADGIEGSYVWAEGETRTSISIADRSRPTAPMTEFYEDSQPIAVETWLELEARARDALEGGDLLCLSGGLIAGAPIDGYRRLVDLAHRTGVPVALDSHGSYLSRGIEAGPELLKVNASEAAAALGARPPGGDVLSWAGEAAMALQARAGAETACIVTSGAEGMALADPDGRVYHGRLDHLGRFPVGSGDAALAALAIAMSARRPWPEALATALGAAGASASTPGPGLLDRAEADLLTIRSVVERVPL
jgi:1-phosphofructokinase family hexose kinase